MRTQAHHLNIFPTLSTDTKTKTSTLYELLQTESRGMRYPLAKQKAKPTVHILVVIITEFQK